MNDHLTPLLAMIGGIKDAVHTVVYHRDRMQIQIKDKEGNILVSDASGNIVALPPPKEAKVIPPGNYLPLPKENELGTFQKKVIPAIAKAINKENKLNVVDSAANPWEYRVGAPAPVSAPST